MQLVRALGRRWHMLLAGIVMTWCLVAAVDNLRHAGTPRHPIAELESQFAALIPHLPPHGEVGFLEHHDMPASEDAVRTWYTAQYALSPRIIVGRHGTEFLIAAHGNAHPAGDARLDGYVPVHTGPGGHQIYRRFLP